MDVTVAVPLYPGSTLRFESTDTRPVPLAVAARAVVVVAVRAAVVRPALVAVRATVAPLAAVVARVAPPVVRAAAARVAAVDVVALVDVAVPARGDVVVVPRDATVRDASVRPDVVVRAATTRDEFPFADPRPDVAATPEDAGIARVDVVRFAAGVAFTGAREIFTGVCVSVVAVSVSASTISAPGATKKPFSSYMPSAYSSAPSSSIKTGATSANAGSTSSPPISIASRFMVKISFLCVKFIIL